MTRQLFYAIFKVDTGWMGVLGSEIGLRLITLPQPSVQEARRLLGNGINRAAQSPQHFHDLMECLRMYFRGQETAFPVNLDLSGATAFQRDVWETIRAIPYGETRSYGWVAGQIKKPGAARAVGQALGRNPLLIIIPCHRVIAGNGSLGGFSGGIECKKQLLHLEVAYSRIT